ncbi:rhomboid family intramembrane serine protease [Lujinxingia vulgaris]|uniref:Rhomboid family intramembrane serine protease n=1 Tax=Lujinxingia vulgaris TaxID=2600176 RepID=A0A5C6X0W4_9DELT|nr:rhomboid family intramembrane serine protease [Lujinxingia vulgaris]TXD31805.1 rhomboid family intramembrane serine protease [Lujinxingia vulgaris]
MSDEPSSDAPERDERAPTTIPMVSPALITRSFAMLLGGLCFGVWLLIGEAEAWLGGDLPAIASLAPLAVALLAIAIRKIWLPSGAQTIRFGDESLTLPRSRTSRRSDTLNYSDLRTAVPLVVRREPALVIDTLARTYVYTASDFPHPETWRLVWAEMLERVRARPEGNAQLVRMRQLAELSQEITGGRPWFTPRFLIVLAIAFAAQSFLTPSLDVLEHLYAGANSRVMVLEHGQIWRVFTANLLHGGLVHFGINAMGLLFLGTYLERLMGIAPTIVLTLATALAGALASLYGSDALFSVGISTALFGLLGAYLALHLRFEKELPPPYRQTRRWWTTILGLNVAASLFIPVIDAWGHFGGLFAGLALGFVVLRGRESFSPPTPASALTNLSAALLVAAFTLAAFFALHYGSGDHPDDEIYVALDLLERIEEPADAAMAIELAARWHEHAPSPDDRLQGILLSLSQRGIKLTDEPYLAWRATSTRMVLADDLAETDPSRADAIRQSTILDFEHFTRAHPGPATWQALAHLLTSHRARTESHLRAEGLPSIRVERGEVTDELLVHLSAPPPRPMRIYALASGEDASHALIVSCLHANSTSPVRTEAPPGGDRVYTPLLSADAPDCDAAGAWDMVPIPPSEPD